MASFKSASVVAIPPVRSLILVRRDSLVAPSWLPADALHSYPKRTHEIRGVNCNVERAIRLLLISIPPTCSGRLAETCLPSTGSVDSNSSLRSVQGQ